MIQHWCLEEYICSNPLVYKKPIIKGGYIIGYWKSKFFPILQISKNTPSKECTSLVFGRVHSFQSSSFQEAYHKGTVHHWLMDEYIHSKKRSVKEMYIIWLWKITFIQFLCSQETNHKGILYYWFWEEYIHFKSSHLVFQKLIIKYWYLIGFLGESTISSQVISQQEHFIIKNMNESIKGVNAMSASDTQFMPLNK